MILQLAKTSPYLTGQFKLDIELFYRDGEIRSGDCHVSPLSDSLGETDSSDVPFFNCKLSDHIKRLRTRLGDLFYSDSPSLTSEKILYGNNQVSGELKWQDTYDHTYQSGVSRMRYEKYGKQFQLLCPVWVDRADDLLSTEFIFKIKAFDSDVETAESAFSFSGDLRKVLQEYLTGISPDLLNINLDREEVNIKGLEASTGTVITKDVSYYLDKLLDRERPVIETDSMLCQLLPSNDMIARQVINLNFCFNMTDIMPEYFASAMQMHQWTVWCDMRKLISTEKVHSASDPYRKIPFCDLYTNYWHIPSYAGDSANGHFDDSKNALDYLEDHRCVDYIMVNKVTQPIFHWALLENPDYLYNYYNGFSPVTIDQDGRDSLAQGLFFGQPNPYQKEYKVGTNTLNWCKIHDLRTSQNVLADTENLYSSMGDSAFSRFEAKMNGVNWSMGMKFSESDVYYPPTYVNIIYVNEEDIEDIYSNVYMGSMQSYDPNKALVLMHTTSPYIFASLLVDPSFPKALDALSLWNVLHGNFIDALCATDASDIHDLIDSINGIFKCYVYPWTIEFNKSLFGQRVESPSSDSKELRYYKSDLNHSSKVYRYTGSLIPMTIDFNDSEKYNWDFFYKKIDSNFLSTEEGKKYNSFLKTGYSQVYPSIDYFPLDAKKAAYSPDPERYPLGFEVKWCKNGRIYNLPETVVVTDTPINGQKANDDYFYSLLLTELSKRLAQCGSSAASGFPLAFGPQIRKAYSYKADWDYESETDINSMSAVVTFKLR